MVPHYLKSEVHMKSPNKNAENTSSDFKPIRHKGVSYSKYGYYFLIPFFLVYVVFSLVPLLTTIVNSFFENYRTGLTQVGPNFVGFENYVKLFSNDNLLKYTSNTLLLWILGFIPQILVSLLLAWWFTNRTLNLKGQRFFKTVIYLPNIIMPAAFAMLFFTLFSDNGPVNNILVSSGIVDEKIRFLSTIWGTRGLIAFMNFLMWFGNTTILLMSGMLGIDPALFEAAKVDGASSNQVFLHITMPLLKPIFIYVLITSLIGGIQMFDVPEILTNGAGNPNRISMTLLMFLNNHLYSKNYGMSGALSVFIFIITLILSILVAKVIRRQSSGDY